MYVHFMLNRVVAARVAEHPFDVFSSRAGFYQTWHLTDLDQEAHEGNPRSTFASVGFSLRGGIAEGTSLGRGEERDVDDPFLGFHLPLSEGTAGRRFRLEMHWWEARGHTVKVKALFTAAGLSLAQRALNETEGNADKAAGLFDRVLRTTPLVAEMPEPAEATRVRWQRVDGDLLPAFGLLLERARQSDDRHVATHRFTLEARPDQGKIFWRMVSPAGPSSWRAGEATQKVRLLVGGADQPHQLMATYRCRLLE